MADYTIFAVETVNRETNMKAPRFANILYHPFTDRQIVPTLLHLAKRGKFDAMIRLLESDDHQFYLDECADSANHHGTLNMFLGKSTLQLVMAYRPPVALVDLLIRRCGEHNLNHCPEDSIDMQGRTPLHAAVQHGCSFETCERLMGDNLPVIMKDQMDRTPLHYACMNARKVRVTNLLNRSRQRMKRSERNQSSSASEEENSYKIIFALLTAYPEATIIADIYGKTPIMLATENRANDRVVSLLANIRNRIEQPISCDDGINNLLGSSMFTITSSSFSSDEDVSSVGSCGISSIEI